jgi:POT family proton-dependent oligopeptide transporter
MRDSCLFYSGINLGAFFGGFVISIGKGTLFADAIPENFRWNVAFGLAALVMMISLVNFIFTKQKLGPIGESPIDVSKSENKWRQYAVYIGTLLIIPAIMKMVANTQYTDWFMYIIGPFSIIYLLYEMTKNTATENKKLVAAFFFIIFSVVFWAIFEQAGGSLSLFAASNVNTKLLGLTMDPNAVNNSVNSLFVIIFAPVVGILFIKMARRKIEPNSVIKFGLGFLLLGLAFYTFYSIRLSADTNGFGSLNLLALGYFVVTFAELFLSPIGLSLMTKLAPYRLQGFMMGMWFLASAYGQYVAGIFGAGISPDSNATNMDKMLIYTQGYKDFALYAILAGVVLLVISPMVKKLMQEVR